MSHIGIQRDGPYPGSTKGFVIQILHAWMQRFAQELVQTILAQTFRERNVKKLKLLKNWA